MSWYRLLNKIEHARNLSGSIYVYHRRVPLSIVIKCKIPPFLLAVSSFLAFDGQVARLLRSDCAVPFRFESRDRSSSPHQYTFLLAQHIIHSCIITTKDVSERPYVNGAVAQGHTFYVTSSTRTLPSPSNWILRDSGASHSKVRGTCLSDGPVAASPFPTVIYLPPGAKLSFLVLSDGRHGARTCLGCRRRSGRWTR